MKRLIPIVLVLLLALPATWALFRPGFFPSHDGDWMVIRLSAFHQALADGQFPVRWSFRLNHNFGYPVLNFLYPLPFYLGEVFYLISHSFSEATKLVFIFSFFTSALTMFFWLKHRLSIWAALAGASIYVYTPYRFVDTYVRGSIGESLGFVFIPLVFLAIDLIPIRRRWAIIGGALAAAGLVLSHNVFVLFLGVALIYGLITLPKKFLPHLSLMLLLGASLSAYFWLPALWELKLVYASQTPVTNPVDHLVNLRQLILPSWNYGPANPNQPTSMSFQIGLINWLVVGVSILFFKKRLEKLGLFLSLTFFISVFLMLKISVPFWQLLPPAAQFIQFPWRLLAMTTFVSAPLVAWLLEAFKFKLLPLLVILVAIGINFKYARPQSYTFTPDSVYATNDDTTTVRQEYLPLWVKHKPKERLGDRIIFTSGRGVITNFKETNREIVFIADASEKNVPTKIRLAQIYYPGWQATIKGQPSAIDYSDNGLISLSLDWGTSPVRVFWKEPPYRQVVNYFSLITLFALISHSFYLLWRHS